MTVVYMLINYNMGFEEHVIDELKRIESVKEIQGVFGMFDVLVKIESSEVKTLDQTVLMKIQKIKHIQLIQTLIVYEQE
ncbi:MAG: Lrp/AsnC ligand binding domain-containing protein [Nitrosopumilus sp.]|nr:Lrp/AsnC ligand binding domain-containing protein [Nitrosopumilus sp.]